MSAGLTENLRIRVEPCLRHRIIEHCGTDNLSHSIRWLLLFALDTLEAQPPRGHHPYRTRALDNYRLMGHNGAIVRTPPIG